MLIVIRIFSFVFNTPAIERLIKRNYVPRELPSLIEDIFVSEDVNDTVRCLTKEDAQTFIDAIDEVRYTSTHSRGFVCLVVTHQPGTRYARPFIMVPKPMSEATLQDLWPPRTSSENDGGTCQLRPNWPRLIQWRVCRCVEGTTLWSGCCRKGRKDVLR